MLRRLWISRDPSKARLRRVYRRRGRLPRFEMLENRRMLSTCTFEGPVLTSLTTCRNWVTYTPSQRDDGYNPNTGNDASLEHIGQDLQQLYDEGFRGLVTYTLDGNLAQAPKIAKDIGFTHVIAGIFWFDDAQLEREKQAARDQWPHYDALIVGNEGLLDGRYTRERLEEEIKGLQLLIGKPVATTETGGQLLADPSLLDIGDFAMVNIQPWFNPANNPNDPAAIAQAVAGEYQALLAADLDQLIVVKESWWPTSGHAAATEANQSAFFEALVATDVPFVWGEAYDQPWKTGEQSPFGTFGPSWGLHDSSGTAKSTINDLSADIADSYYPLDEFLTTAMTVVRRLDSRDVTGGLPLNEATAAELDTLGSGQLVTRQSHFVPAQLGFWFTVAVGSHALRAADPDFTAGYDNAELISELDAAINKLEAILAAPNNVYVDAQTGGKALYQRYDTQTGETLQRDDFERTVPLIDNAYLIAGLEVARQYLLRPPAGVDAGDAQTLAARLVAILSEFNLRMWFDGTDLRIGGRGTLDPRTGSAFNRITTETRLAPVLALARGELTETEFRDIVSRAVSAGQVGANVGGQEVERTASGGTALETNVATMFLPHERSTMFGSGALYPYVRAWSETVASFNPPLEAFGATGVSTQNGFLDFRLRPAEFPGAFIDSQVLVPLASAVTAGSLAAPWHGPLERIAVEALDNFTAALQATKDQGQFHATYGVPNAVDFGSGLVGQPRIWGFLEVAQAVAAMTDARLGGDFYFDLLRRDSAFELAAFVYETALNTAEFEFDRNDLDPGALACRPAASGGALEGVGGFACDGGATWHIENVGDSLKREIFTRIRGDYEIIVTYSNDNVDGQPGDVVNVLVNGVPAGQFTTEDTDDWNVFIQTPKILLVGLAPGVHEVAFELASTDGFGVDLDMFHVELVRADWRNPVNDVDVTGDGLATPLDVLTLIAYINGQPNNSSVPSLPATPSPFYDIDGNGIVSPLDVLFAISFINAQSTGASEGEGELGYIEELQWLRIWEGEGPAESTSHDVAARHQPRPPVLKQSSSEIDGRSHAANVDAVMRDDSDRVLDPPLDDLTLNAIEWLDGDIQQSFAQSGLLELDLV